MSRKEFTLDACFGMPLVPAVAGCCKLLDEGLVTERFEYNATEQVYQIWLRGCRHMALDVRDKMSELAALPNTSASWDQLGGCEPGEIGLLLQELQRIEFLPKRPGD